MRLVIIESPFAGDRERNHRYLRDAMAHSLSRGEAPFASHALYPLVLDDDDKGQRQQGIEAGLAWGQRADLVAVYHDLGVSSGMLMGIRRAVQEGRPVEFRSLAGWVQTPPFEVEPVTAMISAAATSRAAQLAVHAALRERVDEILCRVSELRETMAGAEILSEKEAEELWRKIQDSCRR